MDKVDLKIDWATHEAAKYACKNWHYSGCMPVAKIVKIGIWEGGKFIGVVLFSKGTCGHLFNRFGLDKKSGCELTRVALTTHKTPVRECYMMELDPKYCDVIIKRWKDFTGNDATLDGKKYNDMI